VIYRKKLTPENTYNTIFQWPCLFTVSFNTSIYEGDEMIFQYEMPTKIFVGSLRCYAQEFSSYGDKALIVTGRSSASNGSLNDVLAILSELHIVANVFNDVEENPSDENVMEAVQMGRDTGAEFIIGIGGGSPLDAAKAAALLIPNPDKSSTDLWQANSLDGRKRLPVLAIPTTAGTGSEVTPFAIITTHERQTKSSLPHFLFPDKAFLDAEYTSHMPDSVTLHTAIDALSHLIEGYLSSRANLLSDRLAEGGLGVYSEESSHLMSCMRKKQFDMQVRNKLLINSALAGIVITQTRTTLPHQMGYYLTYNKKTPHGAACGILMAEYMRFHQNKEKVGNILRLLGLSDIDEFKEWMRHVLDLSLSVTADEIDAYTQAVCSNLEKLKTHPFPVTAGDIHNIFTRSVV